MAIRGELLSADLSNVFQMLALNRKRGRLTVQEQGRLENRRRLYFRDDRVVLDEPLRERPVLALLAEMDLLSYDAYRKHADSKRRGTDLVAALQRRGILGEEGVNQLASRLEEEAILEVFQWRNISFELDEEAPDPATDQDGFPVSQLIMEAARRNDEWAEFVDPGTMGREIFGPTGQDPSKPLAKSLLQRIVFDHVDGVRGSKTISEVTGLPRYQVDITLGALQNQGLIAPFAPDQLLEMGIELLGAKRGVDAVLVLRAAQRYQPRDPEIHLLLAQAHQMAGDLCRAGSHFRFCAANELSSGRHEEAIALYRHVMEVLPTDLRSLEETLQLMARQGPAGGVANKDPVLEQGHRLFAYFLDTQQTARAISVGDHLLEIVPTDSKIRAQVARLHLREGHVELAVQGYLAEADRQQAAGDLEGALNTYRMLSTADPANRQMFQARMVEVQRLRSDRSRRAVRRRVSIGAIALVPLFGLAYGIHHWKASRDFALIAASPDRYPEHLEAKAEAFEELASRYTFTLVAESARLEAVKLRTRAETLVEERAIAVERQALERSVAVRSAEQALARGYSLMRTRGRLQESLEAFSAAVAFVDQVGAEWENRGSAETEINAIRTYMEQGRRLLEEGEKAYGAGDVEAAWTSLQRARSEFFSLPGFDPAALTLPIRIETLPDTAEIRLHSGTEVVTGQGRLDRRLPPTVPVVVEVSAPGCRSVQVEVVPERGPWRTLVILEREPMAESTLAMPLVSLQALDSDRFLGMSRDGRPEVFTVDGQSLVAHGGPSTAGAVPRPLARGPAGVLVPSARGLLRLIDPETLQTRWSRSPFNDGPRRTILGAFPVEGDFLVLSIPDAQLPTASATITRVAGTGHGSVWESELPARPRSAVVSGAFIAVSLERGGLMFLNAADGADAGMNPGPFSRDPVVGDDGRFLVFRPGVGLVAISGSPGEEEVVLRTKRELEAGPVVCGGRVFLAVAGEGLHVVSRGRNQLLALSQPIDAIAAGPGNLGAVRLQDGGVFVVDGETLDIRFGARAEAGSPLLAVSEHYLIAGRGGSRIAVWPLR